MWATAAVQGMAGWHKVTCAPTMLRAFLPAGTAHHLHTVFRPRAAPNFGRQVLFRSVVTVVKPVRHGHFPALPVCPRATFVLPVLISTITGRIRVAQCMPGEPRKLAMLHQPTGPVAIGLPSKEHTRRWTHRAAVGFYNALSLFGRLLWIATSFLPVMLLYPIACLWPFVPEEAEGVAEWWWRYLGWVLERSGPTAIKFAQWASTRRDMFSSAFCNQLSRLHASRTPHAFSHSQRTIEAMFGLPLSEIFESIDHEPIGSGCVAQVHKGVLTVRMAKHARVAKRQVAVKVLHPQVFDLIAKDLVIITFFARLIDALPGMRWFGLVDSVMQFAMVMHHQLDFRIEARNLQMFNANFQDDPSAVFPRPVYPYVAREVLVETFESGTPISEFVPKTSAQQTAAQIRFRRRLARSGLNTFLRMVLVHRFVHGDLHPGNILVAGDNTETARHGEAGLIFLDAGIVTELNDRDGDNFFALFDAIVRNDGRRAGLLMIENAREHECEDPEAFAMAIAELVDMVHTTSLSLAVVDVGDVMTRVLALVRQHKVMIEPNYASLVLGIVVMEGLGRSLDPNLDIVKASLPILAMARLERLMQALQTDEKTKILRDYVWAMLNLHDGLVV